MPVLAYDTKPCGYMEKAILNKKSNRSQAVAEPAYWNGVEPNEKITHKVWSTNEQAAIAQN